MNGWTRANSVVIALCLLSACSNDSGQTNGSDTLLHSRIVDAAQSSVVIHPMRGIPADGQSKATIQIMLKDKDGNPVPNELVHVASTGSNHKIELNTAITNESGVVLGTISSTTAEEKTISVSAGVASSPLMVQPKISFGSLFQNAVSYPAGSGAYSLASGDLNSDGHKDIVTNGDETVAVLLGKADGSFALPAQYPTGTAANDDPWPVALGDLNKDGKLDVAVGNSFSSSFSVFLGNGDGTLAVTRNFPSANGARSISILDFNGDGNNDILVGYQSSASSAGIQVFQGNGTGSTFTLSNNFAIAGSNRFITSDLNGDAKPDLIATGSGGVSILLSPAYSASLVSMNISLKFPSGLNLSDLDQDGIPDLSISDPDAKAVTILKGKGNGAFEFLKQVGSDCDSYSLALGDIDGDSVTDIIAPSVAGGKLHAYLGSGNASYLLSSSENSVIGAYAVILDDFNSDGKLDVASVGGLSVGAISIHLAK